MLKSLASCFALFVCMTLMAVPSEHVRRLIALDDGTTVYATLTGDNGLSFYLTDDGFVLEETESGFYNTRQKIGQFLSMENNGRKLAPRKVISLQEAPLMSCGHMRVPVILVQFSDVTFQVAEDSAALADYYRKYCNGTMDGKLYSGHGSRGSVRDYFVQQSDSMFLPEFTVIGPVTLDSPMSYYGKNNGMTKDCNLESMRTESIGLAMKSFDDWTRFDNDGDGNVDAVILIYAGIGENCGGGSNAIWPNEHIGNITVDSLTFRSTVSCCELRPAKRDAAGNAISVKADGIGVFIHEFSHVLGMPDFYDTNGVGFGMDIWSVMDYGLYCNNGYNPVCYTAYEREFLGWQKLVTLDGPCTLRIPCFAKGGVGYKVVNDLNSDEYYVLENRQPQGWDDKLGAFGHGLQVTHVDFDSAKWSTNCVNSDFRHQRMTIIAANGLYAGSSTASTMTEYRTTLSGNLYPGDTSNHDLDNGTTPAATVHCGQYMNKPIRDITELADGTVTLKFRPKGTLAVPCGLSVSNVQTDGFTLSWSEVPNAGCYGVRLLRNGNVIQDCDSLTAFELDFTGLDPGWTYQAEVRAMDDCYLNSVWSSVDVTLLTDAISAAAESEERVLVYGSDGKMLGRYYEYELHRMLPYDGMYIVRPLNGNSGKLFVK